MAVEQFSKVCSKCGIEKPATFEFFFRHSEGKFGFRPDCKDCMRIRGQEYRKKNSEALREYAAQYRINNHAKKRALDRAYYIKNKEKALEYTRHRNRKFREEYNARLRRWRKENKHKVNVWTRNRRAKIKQLGGEHTHEEIMAMLAAQKCKCVYCKTDIRDTFQVDHIIPVSKGGRNDKSNLQLLCKPCNLKKNAKDPIEFQKERGMLL